MANETKLRLCDDATARPKVKSCRSGSRQEQLSADRRRPIAQLRPLVAPALIDTLTALTRVSQTAPATLQRCRVRMVDTDDGSTGDGGSAGAALKAHVGK